MTSHLSNSVFKKSVIGLLLIVFVFTGVAAGLVKNILDDNLTTFLDHEIKEDALVINHFLSTISHDIAQPLADKQALGKLTNALPNEDFVVSVHSLTGKPIVQSGIEGSFRQPHQEGFSNLFLNENSWRAYRLDNADLDISISVFAKETVRLSLIDSVTLEVVLTMLLLAPVLVIMTIFIFKWIYGPLQDLATQIENRKSNDISDFETSDVPIETLAIVKKLNVFISKVRKSYEKEKQFAADAAHELRTPLTAASAFVQMLENSPEKLNIEKCLAQLEQVIKQLIELHRVEANLLNQTQDVRLTDVITEAINDFIIAAEQNKIEFELTGSHEFTLRANQSLISILINSLIENAIKYSRKESCIKFEVADNKLVVSNTIDPCVDFNIHRIWDRFYRGSHQDINGSGLGLSIVKEIVRQLNYSIEVNRDGDQFEVTLTFDQ